MRKPFADQLKEDSTAATRALLLRVAELPLPFCLARDINIWLDSDLGRTVEVPSKVK